LLIKYISRAFFRAFCAENGLENKHIHSQQKFRHFSKKNVYLVEIPSLSIILK